MRIAFTHNLQTETGEAQAEFDTPETVAALTRALEGLGHEVTPIDVGGPVSELVAALERANPHLVFNTAEGTVGRHREAFYPALFAELGLPYTGSDALVCALTLDKHMTKAVVAGAGVPVAPGAVVTRSRPQIPAHMTFPAIVKPNAEGSSKGITDRSVAKDRAAAEALVESMVGGYPDGLLVEAFIPGHDVVVPFLEVLSPETDGVLPSVGYVIESESRSDWGIYDFELKHSDADAVSVVAPAPGPAALHAELERLSRIVFDVLGVRDLGRIDWRITPEGEPVFLEINALPSLEPGAGIYASAELVGAGGVPEVLEAVLKSACKRQGLTYSRSERPRRRPVKVGLLYNLKRIKPGTESDPDHEAEFDSQATVDAIAAAIESHGHSVTPIEATRGFPARLESAGVDLVFNIAEGFRGRGRESVVPAVLELLDLPYTGSDAATLAVTLDKALAKRLVREAGGATPDFLLLERPPSKVPPEMGWPLIVKPVAEGSSKGVGTSSVVRDLDELRERVAELVARYKQPALVEAWLPGREFTVGLLGGLRPRVLPPMEIAFKGDAPHPLYTFAHKLDDSGEVQYLAPAPVDPPLKKALEKLARLAWRALGCRDVARIDMRLDAAGRPSFIECNPLPGLTPEWSDLCLIAKSAEMSYEKLVGAILAPALNRRRARGKR